MGKNVMFYVFKGVLLLSKTTENPAILLYMVSYLNMIVSQLNMI